jgi:hypothetical protein
MEVPIWLDAKAIAANEARYRIRLTPEGTPERNRLITGHIDILQVRDGALHLLHYKPDARTNQQPFPRQFPCNLGPRARAGATIRSLGNARSLWR